MKRIIIILILALMVIPRILYAKDQISLYDINLVEEKGEIRFYNKKLDLRFDINGRWLYFGKISKEENLIKPISSIPEVNFKLNQQWAVNETNRQFEGYNYSIGLKGEKLTLSFHFSIETSQRQIIKLSEYYTLYPNRGILQRSASVLNDSVEKSLKTPAFEDFRFNLPGFVIGDPKECVVDVPGPWFPHSYIRPAMAYLDFRNRNIKYMHSAPDASFGIVSISNPIRNLTMATWMQTEGETSYRPHIEFADNRLQLSYFNNRAYFLPKGLIINSDLQHIELFEGDTSMGWKAYKEYAEQTFPIDNNTPDWVGQMVLLEIYPEYYAGGFTEIEKMLSFYKHIGFNAIYLMPHWEGGYSPINFYSVNKDFGTKEDLKSLIRTAHNLGMKFFFDVVIHGFNDKSPLLESRKDMLVLNPNQSPTRHPVWQSITVDWKSNGYLKYMENLATYHINEYDIDGYRFDAASYKGPGWDSKVNYPAYKSGSNSPEVMKVMLNAMRTVKKDAMILNEIFGPVFNTVSNLTHDNQTEAAQHFLKMYSKGEVSIQDYKKHLAATFALLPEGANRVYFARNHDTSWFYDFEGYSNEFLNLDAIHALCAIPEVFAGDNLKNRGNENPDDNPKTWEFYRKLFKVRQAMPDLVESELILNEVESNHSDVFTAIRSNSKKAYLVVISFSKQQIETQISLSQKFSNARLVYTYDVKMENRIKNQALRSLRLEPFQVLIMELSHL